MGPNLTQVSITLHTSDPTTLAVRHLTWSNGQVVGGSWRGWARDQFVGGTSAERIVGETADR